MSNTNNRRELLIARTCIFATLTAFFGLFHFLYSEASAEYMAHNRRGLYETVLFTVVLFFMSYGSLLYQICLAGYYKRKLKHRPASRESLEALYGTKAPALAILIPSYKEERKVIWQTMVSAALSEYPVKDVVLLIDDPQQPKSSADIRLLEDARAIPAELQQRFDIPLQRYQTELDAFEARCAAGKAYSGVELNRLSLLYEDVSGWLYGLAAEFLDGKSLASLSHIDRFFVKQIIHAPAQAHSARAEDMRLYVGAGAVTLGTIRIQYQRLVGLFHNRFSSFERKKYANLSHESNKAMNLNSYISLMGKSWKEQPSSQGLLLEECTPAEAHFAIAAPDYVNTIDADSQMLSDYVLSLVHVMQKPGNDRIAVIQSPCSAFPECPEGLERVAGISIDTGFHTHQGYTHWDATFWVGANAMLRFTALQEIRETREENGHTVSLYIQDRTVIEDTESTIDLVHKGWKLYNYPERMTFSPTPPDFGSLLIQRRRWANGHILILPKLFHYAWHARKSLTLFKELFMRLNYLISTMTGCFVALVLFGVPFSEHAFNPWIYLSVLPFLVLFIRDLRNCGYRASDFFRVCALNLMLVPVLTGGLIKSAQQVLTGRKIPFGRTPKIPGRTAAPALYSMLELMLPIFCLYTAVHDAEIGQWAKSEMAFVNTLFFLYAIMFFMGAKATMEDITGGMKVLGSRVSAWVEHEVAEPLRRLPLLLAKMARG